MSSPSLPKAKKLPWLKLTVLCVALAVGAWAVLRGANPRELADQGMALIRAVGPTAFFAAMVVLPAVGAPMSAFTLSAGEAFGNRFTLPGVMVIALAMIAINLALTYWLARYALRPLLLRLVARYGFKVPSVTPANALSVALVCG